MRSGWYGLAAAKAYIELHPKEKIAVLESEESCGGTWSKNRLYPCLKSNNMIGTYEYPDLPMSEDKYSVRPFNHIPAAVLHQYLTDFAKHFHVFERIRFHTKVDVMEPSETGGWDLAVTGPSGSRKVTTAKLILTTGLTSTPNMPTYKGADSFGAPLFHVKYFSKEFPNLKGTKNAVVVGGAKSAFEASYAMVEAGATVDLVIRDDGHGPVWISPSLVTPFRKRLDQLLHLRWMSWFSPCPWGGEDGFPRVRRFLHGTAIGRTIVNFFWKILSSDVVTLNSYDSHPELQKLKPWHSAFWIGSGLSVLNYPSSLLDLVKSGKIRVHIGNIESLSHKRVHLADGNTLDADVMICCTGGKKDAPIKFQGLGSKGFGLPVSDEEKLALNNQADGDVLEMFPRLRYQPQLKFEPKNEEPLRLYRFMVPSSLIFKRTLAFAGAVSTVSTSICAAIQAHWITAYFDNRLDRMPSSREDCVGEIILHTQWGKWRYGECGYGASLSDFVFESIPYADLLLNDLGLETRRKKSLIQELTTPYVPGGL